MSANNQDREQAGYIWQEGVWDGISRTYADEIDNRFAPVVDAVIDRAALRPDDRVLDLGCGTGAVAVKAASLVGETGRVVGVDISQEMLAHARKRMTDVESGTIDFRVGRAEEIPSTDGVFDCVLASLSLMYAIDRAVAARECARVLRRGGRFVAAVWAGAEESDIVLFQRTAGSFAPEPPVSGVGPGALAHCEDFMEQLHGAGISVRLERETLGFQFPDFATAWRVLAAVTTSQLPANEQRLARETVFQLMWPTGDGPRYFRNVTQFLVGNRD